MGDACLETTVKLHPQASWRISSKSVDLPLAFTSPASDFAPLGQFVWNFTNLQMLGSCLWLESEQAPQSYVLSLATCHPLPHCLHPTLHPLVNSHHCALDFGLQMQVMAPTWGCKFLHLLKLGCSNGCTRLWIYWNCWLVYSKWVSCMAVEIYWVLGIKNNMLQQVFLKLLIDVSILNLGPRGIILRGLKSSRIYVKLVSTLDKVLNRM